MADEDERKRIRRLKKSLAKGKARQTDAELEELSKKKIMDVAYERIYEDPPLDWQAYDLDNSTQVNTNLEEHLKRLETARIGRTAERTRARITELHNLSEEQIIQNIRNYQQRGFVSPNPAPPPDVHPRQQPVTPGAFILSELLREFGSSGGILPAGATPTYGDTPPFATQRAPSPPPFATQPPSSDVIESGGGRVGNVQYVINQETTGRGRGRRRGGGGRRGRR